MTSTLKFVVVETDGGEERSDYTVTHVLKDDASTYCSEAQRNVNIIFTSDKGGSFVLRRVVVRAPGTNFTAPVHTGLVFVFRERPTFAMLQAFNDYTKERFLAAKAAAERSKKFDGVPVGFFTVSGHSASATIDLPPYAAGSFVVVKLIDATGSGTNIDCEYIGLFADEAVLPLDGSPYSHFAVRPMLPPTGDMQVKELGLQFFALLLSSLRQADASSVRVPLELLARQLDSAAPLQMFPDWTPPRQAREEPLEILPDWVLSSDADAATSTPAKALASAGGSWRSSRGVVLASWSVNFPEPTAVSSLSFDWHSGMLARELQVAVSTDGSGWQTVFRLNADTVPSSVYVPLSGLPQARHLRGVRLTFGLPHSTNTAGTVGIERVVLSRLGTKGMHTEPRRTIALLEEWVAQTCALPDPLLQRMGLRALERLALASGALGTMLRLTEVLLDDGISLPDGAEQEATAFVHTLVAKAQELEDAVVEAEVQRSKEGVQGSGELVDAAFDPDAMSSGLVLSNSNRTVKCDNGANAHVLANVGFTRGKAYWEFRLDEDTNSQTSCFGAAVKPVSNSSYERSKELWMLRAYNGQLYDRGQTSGKRLSKVFKGDVVRVDLDMDEGTIRYSVNGADQGVAFTGVAGEVFPAVAFYGSNRTVTLLSVHGASATAGDPLDSLEEVASYTAVGELGKGAELGHGGHKVCVAKRNYMQSISLHPPPPPTAGASAADQPDCAFAEFALGQEYEEINGEVAVNDSAEAAKMQEAGTSLVFEVHVDGTMRWRSPAVTAPGEPIHFSVPLLDAKLVRLVVTARGSNVMAHAVWVNPTLVRQSQYRKWYRTLFKHVPRPLAGLPPLTAAALAEADPRTRRLHFARSTLAALAALSNVYARSTRSASVVPPPSGLATLQLEEPYSVEVRADTVNQLVALLHRAMSSLGAGASGGDAHASVAHSLLTLVEGCLRRLVLSRVRPAEVGLGAPEAAAGAEESKVAVEDAESKDDAADAEGMHPAVKLLYQQLRRILAPGAAFPPPLRRAADAALNAGLPVFFPDDSARRRVVEGMLGPAGGVVELQYNWPALSPDGGDDSRMERLLLLVQVKARRNGWKCRVMGKWLSLVHLVLELGDEVDPSLFLSEDLAAGLAQAELHTWDFPDGSSDPLIPLTVHHEAGLDRTHLIAHNPGSGALRVFPRGVVSFEALCEEVQRQSPWSVAQ